MNQSTAIQDHSSSYLSSLRLLLNQNPDKFNSVQSMAETEQPNGGVFVEFGDGVSTSTARSKRNEGEIVTLLGALRRLLSDVFYPEDPSPAPVHHRVKKSFYKHGSLVPEGARNSSRSVIVWTKRGSPLRALFVISVSTISLLVLSGLLIFTLFFLTATINAIIISLLISLAAAGGFLALFFVCLTAIYIGALSVAVFAISTGTISTIIAVLIATGWIGFFWIVWLAISKSINLAKHSVSMTGSALSSFSSAHQSRHHEEVDKKDD